MTTPAVEERPTTQADPKAPLTEEPKAPSTDPGEAVQTPSIPDTASTEGDTPTSPPDARAQRVEALAEAEREEIRQQTREQVTAELQGRTPEQLKDATKQRLRQVFPQTIQAVDTVINAAIDEYGQPRPLTPVEAKRIKDAFENYNRTAAEAAEDTVATTVQQVAYNILPKAAQETLTKLTADETALPNYLNHWVETAALYTKAVKGMSLEEAVKHSPKLKREIEALKLEHFDEGRNQGRSDPAGTSPDAGRDGRAAPANKTFIELEEKYGRGETTKAEDAEYNKLKAARAKAGNSG